jgi:membrane protein YqaA with SNARE-associated domain
VSPLTVAFGWSLAEAVIWPFMPEAVLVPLATAHPGRWWKLAIAAALGSTCGGAVSYAIGAAGAADRLLPRLPLVRPAMVRDARGWLTQEGGIGLRHQPLSGLPVKVFALAAAPSGVSLPAFLCCAAVARAARFMVVCAGAALAGKALQPGIERRPIIFLVAWAAAFGVGLRQTVASWERRDTSPP